VQFRRNFKCVAITDKCIARFAIPHREIAQILDEMGTILEILDDKNWQGFSPVRGRRPADWTKRLVETERLLTNQRGFSTIQWKARLEEAAQEMRKSIGQARQFWLGKKSGYYFLIRQSGSRLAMGISDEDYRRLVREPLRVSDTRTLEAGLFGEYGERISTEPKVIDGHQRYFEFRILAAEEDEQVGRDLKAFEVLLRQRHPAFQIGEIIYDAAEGNLMGGFLLIVTAPRAVTNRLEQTAIFLEEARKTVRRHLDAAEDLRAIGSLSLLETRLDRLIAAQAIARDAPLITRNGKDFRKIERLKLIEWETPVE
jgi:hypothetical protein